MCYLPIIIPDPIFNPPEDDTDDESIIDISFIKEANVQKI